MKKLSITIIALAMIAGIYGTASGVSVAWVSFHGGSEDGSVASAAAVTAGFAAAPDKGYTDILLAAGHTINRVTVPAAGTDLAIAPAVLAELNAAELVIVGRSVNSGSFQQAVEYTSWAVDITKPMIVTSGYIARGGTGGGTRLGYTTGETIPDIGGPTRLLANVPGHPIFANVPLDVNNETTAVLDRVTAPITGNPLQLGTSINNNTLTTGGTLIASVTQDNAVTGARGGPVIAEFPQGTASSHTSPVTFASKRLMFITGSRENGITGEAAGIYDLSAVGQKLFLNSVCYMAGSTTGACTPLVLGDTDGDGTGGEYPADFNPIRDNFRKTPRTRPQGDLTGDTVVGFDDFRQWKAAALGSGTSLEGLDLSFLGTVPEPGSLVLCTMALIALASRRGQRRAMHS